MPHQRSCEAAILRRQRLARLGYSSPTPPGCNFVAVPAPLKDVVKKMSVSRELHLCRKDGLGRFHYARSASWAGYWAGRIGKPELQGDLMAHRAGNDAKHGGARPWRRAPDIVYEADQWMAARVAEGSAGNTARRVALSGDADGSATVSSRRHPCALPRRLKALALQVLAALCREGKCS